MCRTETTVLAPGRQPRRQPRREHALQAATVVASSCFSAESFSSSSTTMISLSVHADDTTMSEGSHVFMSGSV